MNHLSWITALFLSFLHFLSFKGDNTRTVSIAYPVAGIDTATVASGLDVPWEISWGPDNMIWITEQKGWVSIINPVNGSKKTILRLTDVWHLRTAGLLGMALHPDMKNNPYVFLNYTFLKDKKPLSRLVRYTWQGDTLLNPTILHEIPAANGHSGSRLSVSQGKLFWATGDAQDNTFAQDVKSLNGKILRLNLDGSVPDDNPVKGSMVWAMGFRNIQGMVFSPSGELYTSEHGDATDDEVNLIKPMKNYGWPAVQGFAENNEEKVFQQLNSTVDPLKAWTPTVAPAGIDYYSHSAIPAWTNSLLMVSLKGKSLRSLKLNKEESKIESEEVLFENMFGRLRDICVSPSGDVYISTSNRDWNRTMGDPLPGDDRIIRIFASEKPMSYFHTKADAVLTNGAVLYQQYCSSCHGKNGEGLKGVFPALVGSKIVADDRLLIRKILAGSSSGQVDKNIKYDASMPGFSFLSDGELAAVANFIRGFQQQKYPVLDADAIAVHRKN